MKKVKRSHKQEFSSKFLLWIPKRKTGLSNEEAKKRSDLQVDLLMLYVDSERNLFQKNKIQWLKERDENSSFFHKYLAARKRKSVIFELINEYGQTLVNQKDIEEEIFTFFERLYSANSGPRFSPRRINWRPISSFDRVWLERCFEESEIRLAIGIR